MIARKVRRSGFPNVSHVMWPIPVPVGLLSAGLVLFTMPATHDERARPFDALGVFSMASFIVLLLLAVSEGRCYGWGSELIVMLFLVSLASLIVFIIAEL